LAAEAPNEVQAQCYKEAVAAAVQDSVVEIGTQVAADSAHQQHALALAALAQHVPDAFQSTLLHAALAHMNAIVEQSYWRVEALQAVIPQTPDTLLPALLDVVPTLTDPFHQRLAIQALVPRLMPLFSDALVDVAQSIADLGQRADALMDLLPYTPEAQRHTITQAILGAVRAVESPGWFVRSLARCAPHAPEPERSAVLDFALDALPTLPLSGGAALPAVTDTAAFGRVMERQHSLTGDALLAWHESLCQQGSVQELSIDTLERIWARIDLGAALPAEQHLSLFAAALAMIMALHSAYWQAQLLIGLAPRMPESLMPAALSFARSLPAAERAQALLGFLPRLAPTDLPSLIDEIVQLTTPTVSVSQRAAVLTQLVATIPGVVPADVLERALDAASAYPGYDIGANYLLQLVPYLPLEQRDAMWREALEAALAIDEEEWRCQPVVTMCAQMPETLLAEGLRAAGTFHTKFG
jgi:hypothetical protein